MNKRISQRAAGFTLLEILVAILILSIGLLGLASLQASGLRSNHSGYLRSKATIFAYEMADRLRANRATAIAGNYNIVFSADPPSGTAIQNVDRRDWLTALAASLPSGDGKIDCSNTGLCMLEIEWVDNRNLAPTDPNYKVNFKMATQI
ncbi:MAG: type IV pilus modification protein PilV [Candidatus Competibacteraceae bacterium]|nr:type IV pilus modification protein PilV [Candidatus Competibacteraceae bacterium]